MAAVVVRSGKPPVMIDLGLVEPIDSAVREWREVKCGQLAGRADNLQPGAVLRSLVWDKLLRQLNGDSHCFDFTRRFIESNRLVGFAWKSAGVVFA